jgi:uncharacterized protein YaiE (UPF0345 family)
MTNNVTVQIERSEADVAAIKVAVERAVEAERQRLASQKLYWHCSNCGVRELAQDDYQHGDSEECVDCDGRAVVRTLLEIEIMQWRCFRCGEVFTVEAEAQQHFGVKRDSKTRCQVELKSLRAQVAAQEAELQSLRTERDGLMADLSQIAGTAGVGVPDREEAKRQICAKLAGTSAPVEQSEVEELTTRIGNCATYRQAAEEALRWMRSRETVVSRKAPEGVGSG